MLYYLVRPVARFVLRCYYRNIDLTGLEHIPQDAAVVFAANHPTAFIEPCVLACFQARTLWFLARGNLFKNGFYNALLAAVHILPVFRLEDGGYGRLKDNYSTFEACFRALSRGRAIMMLAEGRCTHEKALRPIRKGTARLALGAMQRDTTLREVYVVPVGCNFTDGAGVRGQVMIRFGEPLLASRFMDTYRTNEALAIKDFTLHLRQRLSPLVVQFQDRELAALGETRLELDRALHRVDNRHGVTHDGQQLDRELMLAAATPKTQPKLTDLFQRLRVNRVSVGAAAGASLATKQPGPFTRWSKALVAVLLLLPQLPLWALGQYFYDVPKHIEFASPVRFAVICGGAFLLYPPLLFLLPLPVSVWLAFSLITLRWSVRQLEDLHAYRNRRRYAQLVAAERKAINDALQHFRAAER